MAEEKEKAEEKENLQDQAETKATESQVEEATADADSSDTNADLEKLQAEADENRDNYLRAAAELENLRRRNEQDVAQAHKFAIERFAQEVLTVRDSLELACAVEMDPEEGADDQPKAVLNKMHEGLDLTLKQLEGVFEKFNMVLLDPIGEKFDPDQHQAMSMVESADVEPNHVLSVVQKGCLLNDRLLRPAMVIIAKADIAEKDENKAE